MLRPVLTPSNSQEDLFNRLCGFVEIFVLVDFGAFLVKRVSHYLHTCFRVVANEIGKLHGTELRPAHGAEMGCFVGLLRQGLVMEIAGHVFAQGNVFPLLGDDVLVGIVVMVDRLAVL